MSLRELDRKSVFKALTSDGTFATVLHVIALKAYGEEIYQLDILELLMRLEEDFGAKMTEDNESKLNAILLATSTDAFYDDPEAFRGIAETLSNGDPGVELLDDLTFAEVTWALYEIEINREPSEFDPSVQTLIDRTMNEEADDLDEVPDPYQALFTYLHECRGKLAKQLSEVLGISVALPETPAPQVA